MCPLPREALGIIEYWMPISDYKKPNNNFNINKDFREIKKNVGMTIAQKRKWDQSLSCISSQQSLHLRRVASFRL